MVSIRDSKIKDYLPSPSSISSAPKVNVAPAPGIVHGDKLRPMVPKIGLKYTYYLVEKDSIKYNCCEVCLQLIQQKSRTCMLHIVVKVIYILKQ
jgi:hypothetical protein